MSFPSLLARGSVLGTTRQCVALFRRGLSSQSLERQSSVDLENQLGRFKIWAGNVGVFAAGNASIDFRLRNDPDIKEVMIQMLTRLRKSIEQLINPPVVEMPAPEDNDSHHSSSSSSSPSLVLSLDASSDLGSADRNLLQWRQKISYDRLQDIDSVITRLYRLSAVIRKPNPFSENTKVTRFIDKAQDRQDMEEYESHIRWQIQFRHPKASPALVDRLTDAVVFRRKKLLYRERHQQKLSHGVDDAFMDELLVPTGTNATKPCGTNKPQFPRQNSPFLKVAATVKSFSPTLPLSATQASSVNRQGMNSYAKSVAFSGMTKSAIARREQLDVPPLPKPEGDTTEAICPYCFEIVDKAKIARALWTRHILKDIDPYICLFENCDKPNEHFRSVEDWLNHMKWQHTIVWFCPASQHKSELFNSDIGLEQHMRREHSKDFTESQLPILVQKCAQPSSDPFTALASQNDEVRSENMRSCPLCPFSVEKANAQPETDPSLLGADDPTDIIDKLIRNHVAAHLESIALLSLPEQNDLENAASNELQSESAKNDSRQEDNNLPPAVFDDDDDDLPPETYYFRPAIQVLPDTDVEDWEYVYSRSRQRTVFPEPYQDPVLKGFVEEARYREMLKSRLSSIPTIRVYDIQGLEVSEQYWTYGPPGARDTAAVASPAVEEDPSTKD